MKISLLLVISLIVNIWFSFVIIRLEKFHYSTQIGICSEKTVIDGKRLIRSYDDIDMYQCLIKSEPRTSDLWNLLYGLRIL